MAAKVYYEDVKEGMELPVLSKYPTTRQLVKYAGASGDFFELHYDKDFAQKRGLNGVISHGMLGLGWLGQLATDWMGEEGTLRKLGCSYRGVVYPGNEVKCKGTVTKKYIEDGQHFVELEIWIEDAEGKKPTPGTALVILPSRTK